MPGRRSAIRIELDPTTRDQLQAILRRHTAPQALAKRVRAILWLADGASFASTVRQTGLRERHVRKWVARFHKQGLAGLQDHPRSGRPPVFSPSGCGASGQDRL